MMRTAVTFCWNSYSKIKLFCKFKKNIKLFHLSTKSIFRMKQRSLCFYIIIIIIVIIIVVIIIVIIIQIDSRHTCLWVNSSGFLQSKPPFLCQKFSGLLMFSAQSVLATRLLAKDRGNRRMVPSSPHPHIASKAHWVIGVKRPDR